MKIPKGNFKINWPLKRQNGRFVDQIISCQISVNGIVLPISICFLCGLQWMKDLSYFISKKGCYVGPLIVNFTGNYFCCHSFFISLFRYTAFCILRKPFDWGWMLLRLVSILFPTFLIILIAFKHWINNKLKIILLNLKLFW